MSYPEEPTPATFLISLDFLASKKDRAHAAVLIQLIKLERATRHQSTVNWALVVSVLTELLLFMVNKPQHGWQSFRAAHKLPHHMAYSTDTTGSTDGLRPEPLQPPIYALLTSNRAVCRAYIVSIKTEPNLTVYSLHILLAMGSGEEKTDLVPFRASHLLVTVIVLLSLLQHPVQKTMQRIPAMTLSSCLAGTAVIASSGGIHHECGFCLCPCICNTSDISTAVRAGIAH